MKAFLCATALCLSLMGCAHKEETISPAMRIEVVDAKGNPIGVGSGAKISEDEVLTAAHVVFGKGQFFVINENGERASGTLSFVDKERDIAIVKVNIPGKTTPLSCKEQPVGIQYETIGNPLGLKFIHSWGRIASKMQKAGPWKVVYIADGTVISGNSGGAAFARGKVIGVVVGVLLSPGTNGSALGFSFIVPSSEICKVLKIDS